MNLIYFTITISLILINLAGLSALASRWIPSFALARAAGILVVCLTMFFIEHFIGFGKLNWAWPFTTALAGFILYSDRVRLKESGFLRAELVFLIAFAYGFAWRVSFPSVYPSSERVMDLLFIVSYMPGETLPGLHYWYPPNRFDFYYAFQHYAAALMGRIFGLAPGVVYNIAFAILMAQPLTLAWDFAARFIRNHWAKFLLVATLAIGGNGATPFVHLSYQGPVNAQGYELSVETNKYMWAGVRFVGGFDQMLNTEFGHSLFPKKTDGTWTARDLPAENFGYQFFLGDYHPPLGGFALLLMAIALIGALEFKSRQKDAFSEIETSELSEQQSAIYQALLALTIPAMVATNTWTFPLQGMLLLFWIGWRYQQKRPPNWRALLFGGIGGFVLIYPFLTIFTARPLSTPIKLVGLQDHTPLMQFIALHWPIMLFALLGVFQKGTRKFTVMLALAFAFLLAFSEIVYVDDPTGGFQDRTNSTMKWWGFIYTGALVSLGALLLAAKSKAVRVVTVLSLLAINVYLYDVARYYFTTEKSEFGNLYASGTYTRDATVRDMFRYLAKAPMGIVLENQYGDALNDTGIYALFAQKPVLLGWSNHLLTWHSNVGQMFILKDQIKKFYTGDMPDMANWLLAQDVKYIVWSGKDAENRAGWGKIQQAISHEYAWHEFYAAGDFRVGIWTKL